jgi:dienelactone hydrolase
MKKSNFNLVVLLVLIMSSVYIIGCHSSRNKAKTINAKTSSDKTVAKTEPGLFILQPDHPAYRLEGCSVTSDDSNRILFKFRQPGRSVLVLKASAPLMISKDSGLNARLRPGWDGTLGYSLYSLEVEAEKAGTGMVSLISQPVSDGSAQSQAALGNRTSRFPDTREKFLKWQIIWRDKLAGRLMNGSLPSRVPLSAKVINTEDRPLFTLRRVRYQTQPDRGNTLLLSLPKNVSGRVPLMIALHGHETTWGVADSSAFTMGHIDDFCAYFAERGWAVLQPATMNHKLQHPEWTLQGEWTWDAMVALDYAISLPEVDAQNVVVCGLSTGGHLAMNMLALDDRVHAGVVGCVLSTWHHYRERMRIPPHCDCGILGQLGDLIEQCDWAALAAPKPVQFQHGRQDATFCPGADPGLLNTAWNTSVMPEKEFVPMFKEVKRAYQLTSDTGQVKLFIHNWAHRVDNEAAYKFLISAIVK